MVSLKVQFERTLKILKVLQTVRGKYVNCHLLVSIPVWPQTPKKGDKLVHSSHTSLQVWIVTLSGNSQGHIIRLTLNVMSSKSLKFIQVTQPTNTISAYGRKSR